MHPDMNRSDNPRVDATAQRFYRTPSPDESKPKVPQLYWEDFTAGRVFEHGPRRMPRDEMIAFAAEFDPQPMHLDEAAARDTMLGGLAASGWYVCCILMRMCVDAFVGEAASMGAPGVDEVKWLRPVRPGDELTLRATVLESRASKSRPEMGLVRFQFALFDPEGRSVMVLVTSLMIHRRERGAA